MRMASLTSTSLSPGLPACANVSPVWRSNAKHLADEAASHAELQLIIGRLEDFATKVHESLEEADWASKRDLIRTLVKRVEVAQDQVNVVFRVDPYLGDPDPEKKSLQLCRGSDDAALWRATEGFLYGPLLHRTCT